MRAIEQLLEGELRRVGGARVGTARDVERAGSDEHGRRDSDRGGEVERNERGNCGNA